MTPYYEEDGVVIYHGDCREILPGLSVDLVFADPPYGVDKADWDSIFPTEWMPLAATSAQRSLVITPGIVNLLSCPKIIGPQEYRWTLSVSIRNSRMRGAVGFGNWIPFLLYTRGDVSVYSCAQDATSITIRGAMPDHPSPKPEGAIRWVFGRGAEWETMADCFMGSGTSLVIAREMGRKAIGIDNDEKSCEVAARRLSQGVLPFGKLL